MAVQSAKVGRVPRRVLAGWVVDDSYHVVITEIEVAHGALRYPSLHPDAVPFPSEVGLTEQWDGWIDGLNDGGGTGNFLFYVSTTDACTGDVAIVGSEAPGDPTMPFIIDPGGAVALHINWVGPVDWYICWMRYEP